MDKGKCVPDLLAEREEVRLSLTIVLHLKSFKYAGGLGTLEDFLKGTYGTIVEGMIGGIDWERLGAVESTEFSIGKSVEAGTKLSTGKLSKGRVGLEGTSGVERLSDIGTYGMEAGVLEVGKSNKDAGV